MRTKVHFVGIGGIGMSGLAEILLSLKYQVTGSDLALSSITERLHILGASIYEGHSLLNVADDVDMVVYSAAVQADNPELVVAREKGIPIISRGELLADVMRLKKHAVAVAGAHGKTTTTSMIYSIFNHADVESTVIIGGILMRQGSNAFWGTGDYLVAETDEHDGSFLRLSPTVSVVTNIDEEHMEYYPSLEALKAAFLDFIHKVPFYGFSVLCIDDPNVADLLPDICCSKMTYGLSSLADIRAENLTIVGSLHNPLLQFDVVNTNSRWGEVGVLGSVRLHALGKHNMLNALAAVATGLGLGIPFGQIVQGLAEFRGIQRRMDRYLLDRECVLIEDYAHHPTEIRAVLETVRSVHKGRVMIVFQPHLYSRTSYFGEQFADVLMQADQVVLLPVYPAREEPKEGQPTEYIMSFLEQKGYSSATLLSCFDQAREFVCHQRKDGDVILVLGAGDIYQLVRSMIHGSISTASVG